MTRKDYIQTANILKEFIDEIPQTTYEDMVDHFCQRQRGQRRRLQLAQKSRWHAG
jgi:hypothetical protein